MVSRKANLTTVALDLKKRMNQCLLKVWFYQAQQKKNGKGREVERGNNSHKEGEWSSYKKGSHSQRTGHKEETLKCKY